MATGGFSITIRSVGIATCVLWSMFVAGAVGATALHPQLASVPLTTGADRLATGAARVVGAILEYTRWPAGQTPLVLCVVGPALHAGGMDHLSLSNGRTVVRRTISANAEPAGLECDALYLARLDPETLRRWTRAARGMAIVTIAEDDPGCRSEAMFCLRFMPAALSFDLNIDAVSRSGVRIDPRVLRLANGED